MKLGEKLRQLREQRDWTQPDAAQAIGIEQSYLSKLENDHSVPSVEVFRRIVDAYETTVGTVMDGIDRSHFKHLSQVTDIADYLDAKDHARQVQRRGRTTWLTVAVALGACLLYAGMSDMFFPDARISGQAWRNQLVSFVGIFCLTYGLIGLLVAGARQGRREEG